MSTPRWIDKIKGFLQRETDATTTSVATPDSVPTPAGRTVSPPAADAKPAATIPAPPPPKRTAPRPVIPTLNARALAELALKNIAGTGSQIVQFAQQNGLKATPGLDHDLALVMTGYSLTSISMKAHHGEAAQEAQRFTRTNMKTALLSVLRKHYAKSNTDEMKLGANMVTHVDEVLSAADADNNALLTQMQNAGPRFESLAARLAAIYASEAGRFEKLLADQYAKVSQSIALAPKD
ncbi:MAG: hypothetical protein KF799_15880 [Bdellovibrionales bacterium]|nr:hypothetical protein [Bdellovibrionales bacterium]